MKLKVIIMLFLLFYMFSNFANEKQIHFKMPKNGLITTQYKYSNNGMNIQKRKIASSIVMTVFGSILTAGGTAVTGVSGWFGYTNSQNQYETNIYHGVTISALVSIITFGAHILLLGGTILLCAGVHRLSILSWSIYGNALWSSEMSILRRNLGIIMLASSVVPLGTTVLTPFLCARGGVMLALVVIPIISLGMFIAQIVGGVNLILSWFRGKYFSPDISLIHDSKKDITEGYSVRMGLRIRI